MSQSDEPKKKAPPPTLQWDPEEGPPSSPEEENAPSPQEKATPSPPASEEGPGKSTPQPTLQWDPEKESGKDEGNASAEPPPPSEEVSAPEPPMSSKDDPLVGTLLRNKWEVLKRLGAGSFGTVYKVKDVKGGWVEALKILGVDRITGAEAETVRKRFLREAQIMKRLGTQSAHIVGLSTYEEDLEAGLVYFLMEFVEGRSLGEALMEEGPFSVERTLTLALQVCDALMVAHEDEGVVVHRDLKLENIMLARDRAGHEVAKVLDFGIAKLAEKEADSRLTTAGTLGTPGFAAPEQLRAEDVDGRTDLFAFGVILYSLLTGRDPWFGNPANEPTSQVYELMVATERAEMIPFSETGVDVPPALANVVIRLLKRAPEERFQSARELKGALDRIASGGEALEQGSLRVLTDPPGLEVVVRAGRKVVAQGPTPCEAHGLSEGHYRVQLHDQGYEEAETLVTLGPGAMENVSLVANPRKGGMGASLSRHRGILSAAALVILVAVGTLLIQPWGRTLTLDELQAQAAAGGVGEVHLSSRTFHGRLAILGIPAPFRTALREGEVVGAVESLRSSGLSVDTSPEVARLVRLAMEAQRRMTYFGSPGSDVQSFAGQALALDAENQEARSLLMKVAERMAWDAEAALAEGDMERAGALASQCLTLIPDHSGCLAVSESAQGA